MLDQEKSKEQLLQELSEIRHKLDESEAARVKLEKSQNSLNIHDEYRHIVDRTSESIFVYQDGPIKFVNPACRELTGYSDQEALAADAIKDFVHPDDRELVAQYYKSRQQGVTTPYRYPFRILCKDRTVKWVEMKSSLIMWEGKPAALCLMTDITDHKLGEDALRASEENLRLKVSNLISPEYKIEEDEFRNVIDGPRIQSLMDDFYKLTDIGVTISDLKGNVIVVTGWQDICKNFHRVHPVTHQNCIESAIELTADVKEWEYRRYKCKNNMWDIVTPIFMGGKRVGNLLLGQFLFDDEDLDLAVFSAQAEHYGFDKEEYLAALKRVPRWSREKVHTVMTFYSKFASMVGQLSYSNLKLAKTLIDTKRSEEKLERNEMFLNQVLENIPDMIFVKDAETLSLVRLNKAGEDLLGCSRDDLLGKTDYDLFPQSEAESFSSKDKLALATGKLVDIPEEEMDTKLKGKRLLRTKKLPVLDSNGNPQYLLSISEDITDRKRSELESEDLKRQLLHAQKMEAIGTLAGGISHDFNNILQVVLGYSELLLAGKKENGPDYSNVQKIYEAGKNGAELIKGLLTFSRKSEPDLSQCDLNQEIVQVRSFLTRTIPKTIAIDLKLSDDLDPVQVDRSQMSQVLMNLAINARDAMPDGGTLTIETSNIELNETYCRQHLGVDPGRYVLLAVSDSGSGMDNETLAHIYEPFFSTKEIGKGTGLGLSTVYGVIKNHKGQIQCHSEPGQGTTFKIYLPALRNETHSETKNC